MKQRQQNLVNIIALPFPFWMRFCRCQTKETDNAKIDDLKEKFKRHPTFFAD